MPADPDSGAPHGRAEMVRAVILPELVFDMSDGRPPAAGTGVAEWVRAVILPEVIFDLSNPSDGAAPAEPPVPRLAGFAGPLVRAVFATPREHRAEALASFIAAARQQIAAFDPAAANLFGGPPIRD